MHWKFNIDDRSLANAIDDLSIKSVKLSFPDKYPLRVDFYRGNTPYSFTGKLKATIKGTSRQKDFALAVNEVPVNNSATSSVILNLATESMLKFVKDFGDRPAVLELLLLDNSGVRVSSWTVSCPIVRRYTGSGDAVIDAPDFVASQAEAEAGTDNAKWMTPLRVWQATRQWATDFFKWENLQNKPDTFPPSPHTHTDPLDIKQALAAAGVELIDS